MKAFITQSQYDKIRKFINETTELRKDEVLYGDQKNIDFNNNNKIDKQDLKIARASKELDEEKYAWNKCFQDAKKRYGSEKTARKVCGSIRAKSKGFVKEGSDCGCGGSEEHNDTRYMFFSNLEQMMRQARMLLQMDEDMLEDLLNNGHDWAADHIAEAKNNMDQVFDFIMGEMHGEGEDDSWDGEEEGMMYEGDAWASDGGYYSKPERNIRISRQDADFINNVINDFRNSISSEDAIIVDNSREGEINRTIINDLRKNWGVKFDYESEEGTDFYYLAPNQDMQNVNDGLENADQLFYDSTINEGMSLKKKAFVSKELKHHLDKNIPLCESEFRYGSQKHIELIKEVKELYNKGLISLNEADEFIVTEFDPNPVKVKGVGEVYLGLIQEEYQSDEELLSEAVYQGRKVQLNKPKRGGSKKFYVFVRNPKTGKVKKVSFGAKAGGHNLAVKLRDPKAKKSFSARHNCPQKKDRLSAGYWACRLPRFSKALNLSGGGSGYW